MPGTLNVTPASARVKSMYKEWFPFSINHIWGFIFLPCFIYLLPSEFFSLL